MHTLPLYLPYTSPEAIWFITMPYVPPPSFMLGSHPNSRNPIKRGHYVIHTKGQAKFFQVRVFRSEQNALLEGPPEDGLSSIHVVHIPKFNSQGEAKGHVTGWLRIDYCSKEPLPQNEGQPGRSLVKEASQFVHSLISHGHFYPEFVDE